MFYSKSFNELSTNELYKILKVREEVFIVEQNCPYNDLDDKDYTSIHHYYEKDGIILAYTRLIPEGISYECSASIGRVLTTSGARRTGLGKELLKTSIEYIKNNFNSSSVTISAQEYLLEFYQSFGFVVISESYLEDNIPHRKMILDFNKAKELTTND